MITYHLCPAIFALAIACAHACFSQHSARGDDASLAGQLQALYVSQSPHFLRLKKFADRLILDCRDEYGPKKLRIWPNAYDLAAKSVPLPDPQRTFSKHMSGHAPFCCNLQQQSSLLRFLWAMTELTDDEKYRAAVRDGLTDYFAHCAHPKTGAFPWGTHCGYDVTTDTVRSSLPAGLMEEKFADVPWDILYAVDAKATLKHIDHMRLSYNADMTTYFHHREMDRTEMRTPDAVFNTNIITGNHPYTIAGVAHMKAWAFAYSKTQNRKYLDWLQGTFAIHTRTLEPETGLITEIPNLHRFRYWPDSAVEWNRRSVMVKYGDPYLWGYYMFKVSELLSAKNDKLPNDTHASTVSLAKQLIASGQQQLQRWPKAAWDEEAKLYRQNFAIYPPENAAAVEKSNANYFTTPRHGKFWEVVSGKQGYHQMVTGYLAYANAYRRTGEQGFRRTADNLHDTYVDADTFLESEEPGHALLLAIYLQANAELLERSGDERYRKLGRMALEKVEKEFTRENCLVGKAGGTVISHTDGSDDLAAAMLRFDMTDRGLKCPMEDSYLFDWGYSFP